MTPSVTVLMTTYAGTSVEELERSFDSLLGQTLPPTSCSSWSTDRCRVTSTQRSHAAHNTLS